VKKDLGILLDIHQLLFFFLYAIYMDYILEMERVKNNNILKVCIGLAFIIIDFGIIYGRLYLGVHGID